MGGRYVPSLLAAIGGVIETHMIRTGFLAPPRQPGEEEASPEAKALAAGDRRDPTATANRPRESLPALRLPVPAPPGGLPRLQQLRLFQMRLRRPPARRRHAEARAPLTPDRDFVTPIYHPAP